MSADVGIATNSFEDRSTDSTDVAEKTSRGRERRRLCERDTIRRPVRPEN